MAKFVINGPATLNGTVKIGGSKNAAPKILAATLLATEKVVLHNIPAIRDVRMMLEILRHFGMKIEGEAGTVRLDPSALSSAPIPDELATALRSSIVLLGPALARFGEISIAHPGGDLIGQRPLTTHFEGLRALGVTVDQDDGHYRLSAKKLVGTEIFLNEASVTATENVLMAASMAEGTTVIHNAASELHTKDLAVFLNGIGASITGAGTNLVTVTGVPALGGGTHAVRPDEIEAATFMIAAALTGGDVTIEQVDPKNFGIILIKLKEAGVAFTIGDSKIRVKGPHKLIATSIKTNIWPGFPSDLQPPFTILMTQAPGVSIIHDWMYDRRFFYTDKLVTMGANITMADPHRIIVFGPTELVGRTLASPDIRAGVTMLLAGLVASGTTVIDHVEHIERAYERMDERLRDLGADITRLEETG